MAPSNAQVCVTRVASSTTPRRSRQVTGESRLNQSMSCGSASSTPVRRLSKQFGLKWTWIVVDDSTLFVESPMLYGSCKGSRCRSSTNKKQALSAQRNLKKARRALREMKQLVNRLKVRIESYQDTLERANTILQVDLDKDISYGQLLERIRVCVNTLQ